MSAIVHRASILGHRAAADVIASSRRNTTSVGSFRLVRYLIGLPTRNSRS